MRFPARSGAVGLGVLVALVGAWGGIVAYAGPSFGFGMGSSGAWTWTEGRATLHLAPAIAAIVGGLVLLAARTRGTRLLGGLLAMVGGVWFVIGPSLSPLWEGSASAAGSTGSHMMGGAMGSHMMGGTTTSTTMQALQGLGYHYGTGALIAVLAAFAVGLVAAAPAVDAVREREPRPARARLRLRTHP